MLGEHTSIALPQSSEYAKEMRKHEAHHTKWGAPGRPYVFQEYPKMLYKAEYRIGEGIVVADTRTVGDATEEGNMNSRGFFELERAFAVIRQEQTEHGVLAAKREFAVQHNKHSEGAVAEIREAEADHGARHLPDVPKKSKS